MSFSVSAPIVYEGQPASGTHTINLPSASAGDILFVVGQPSLAATVLTINNVSFDVIFTQNSTNNRRLRVFARVVDGTEPGSIEMNTDGASFSLNAAVYRISGASLDFTGIQFESFNGNGTENPPFNPPALTANTGSANYLWFALCAAGQDGGFTAGPTNYTFIAATSGDSGSQLSLGAAHRELEAETENPSPFIAATSAGSISVTMLLPAQTVTTPTLRKTGQQTFSKPAGIGTINTVTLNGEAITLDSQDAETFTVTDSDGSITTSGEYDLVATGDTVETIAVQVNVVGVAPANNPLQKDGAPLANLTDVEVRISAGATLAGTQLFYTGTATTDASGNLGNIDLSDTAADPDDVVLLKIRTADGDSIIAAETVELI